MNTATTTPETTVGEVMTTNLVTLKLDDTLRSPTICWILAGCVTFQFWMATGLQG